MSPIIIFRKKKAEFFMLINLKNKIKEGIKNEKKIK